MSENSADGSFDLMPAIFSIFFAMGFWFVALAFGRRLMMLAGMWIKALTPIEKNLTALLIGTGLMQFVPYILGGVGMLTEKAVRVVVLLVLILSIPQALQILKIIWRTAITSPLRERSLIANIWTIVFISILGFFFVHALALGSLGDDDGYHLSAPLRWLREGSLNYLPSYTNTNTMMGFEMIYLIALSFGEPVGAKLLHFGAGLWMLLAIVLCSRRLESYWTGLIAISLLLIVNPVVNLAYIFPLAYVDLATCWASLMSVLAWLAWRKSDDKRLLPIVALCAGIAGSFKLTMVPIVAIWILIISIDLFLRGDALPTIAKCSLSFGLIAAAPIAIWMARNYWETGNPVYPMLPAFFATRDWSVEHAEVFSQYTRYYSWGVASGTNLTEEARKVLLLVAAFATVSAGLVLGWLRSDATSRWLAVLAVTYTLICIAATGLLFRFWLLGIICFTMIGAAWIYRFVGNVSRIRIIALVTILVALMAQLRAEYRQHPKLLEDLAIAVGGRFSEEARQRDPRWQFWKDVRSVTPRDSKILVAAFYATFGASSFGCFVVDRHCFATDSHLQSYINLGSWRNFLQSVISADIQYILIADRPFEEGRHGFAFAAGANEFPYSSRLGKEFGVPVASGAHLWLYKLRLDEIRNALERLRE